MLSVSWTTVRLFLHVLAATVWVGGQLTLAGLVPGLRRLSPDAPRVVARRLQPRSPGSRSPCSLRRASGTSSRSGRTGRLAYGTTLIVKLVVVAGSGITAALHTAVALPRHARRLRRPLGPYRTRGAVPRRPARRVRVRPRDGSRRGRPRVTNAFISRLREPPPELPRCTGRSNDDIPERARRERHRRRGKLPTRSGFVTNRPVSELMGEPNRSLNRYNPMPARNTVGPSTNRIRGRRSRNCSAIARVVRVVRGT